MLYKWGSPVKTWPITEYHTVGILDSDWMRKTTGCLMEPEVPFFRFSKVHPKKGDFFPANS